MMIFLLIIISLSFLPNLIHCSVPFVLNPNCDVAQCNETGQPALYYANQVVGDNKIHMIYSSFDDLTIMIMQTDKTASPTFNYRAIYAGNFSNAFYFDGAGPVNSFSIILRRLIEFNDANGNGKITDDNNTTNSYFLRNLMMSNITLEKNTDQPSFQYDLDQVDGSLKIDIIYPGEEWRDPKFPKLKTESSSYFLNIALKADNFSFVNPRFAFELYTISPGKEDFSSSLSRQIDDQYTPGIFNVWQMKSSDASLYPSSMLWKPVVYQSEERSIEDNTLMQIYPLKNQVIIDKNIDKGLLDSLFVNKNASAFNVSLGTTDDGYFSKTNYGFIQFTAGLDILQPDSTAKFVTIAVIVALALPALVAIIAVIFIVKRRLSKQTSTGYDTIRN